jgi:hypothetical protein
MQHDATCFFDLFWYVLIFLGDILWYIFLLDFSHGTSYQVTASCSSKVPIPRTTPSSRRQPLQIPPETPNLTATAVQIAVQNWCICAHINLSLSLYLYICVCALYACTIMINHVYKFYKFYYVLFYISYHLLSLGATLFHWDSSTGFQALSLWRDCASNVWCPPWISNYAAWDRCCYTKMSFTFRVLISCLLMHFEFLFRSIDLSPSFICL